MVYLFLAEGFEETEALATADILRRAGLSLALCADGPVTGGHGICVLPDCGVDAVQLDDAELLVLPGGMPGVNNLWADARLRALLQNAAARGIPLAAICAAPLILGRLGLLEGRHAVCYPGFEGELRGARLADAEAVTDSTGAGVIVTAKAAGSVFTFGLELTRLLRGEEKADAVKKAMHIAAKAAVLRV